MLPTAVLRSLPRLWSDSAAVLAFLACAIVRTTHEVFASQRLGPNYSTKRNRKPLPSPAWCREAFLTRKAMPFIQMWGLILLALVVYYPAVALIDFRRKNS